MHSNRSNWPNDPARGINRVEVVLAFTFSLDRKAFAEGLIALAFGAHGCPRQLATRLAMDLVRDGTRTTSVMGTVDLEQLARDLAPLGVTFTVLSTQPASEGV